MPAEISLTLSVVTVCETCRQDWDFLRSTERPDYEAGACKIRVVDLFCGCGGLTLGIAEAARRMDFGVEIPLAVDDDADAIAVFEHNFPSATTEQLRVEDLFNGELGGSLTQSERAVRTRVGRVDILSGGPPCQGHSDLNNHTRRRDPRNGLYDRIARAAEVLKPAVVFAENVPAVVKDADGVVGVAETALIRAGYHVAHRPLNLGGLGVPQRRRRHILLASTKDLLEPEAVLSALEAPCPTHPTRSVAWAIEDLETPPSDDQFDKPSVPSGKNADRIAWLFEHDKYDLDNDERPECHQNDEHTYRSMYGRLKWNEPAQTVTTGFGSMGQGRYVHPSCRRTITPHEAARLQTLPDFFDFSSVHKRGAWAKMIGNAVPPLLACNVVTATMPLIVDDALHAAA